MRWTLPIIVISQFLCTSLWFAGNAVLPDLIREYGLEEGFLAHLTSAVQFGFITGTFIFALLTISDRYSPSRVFMVCAFLGALFNLGMCIEGIHSTGFLLSRFMTGFFLAGVYPVGMKITSDYFQSGLGRSLGLLVGALVLGTASPHLIRSFGLDLPWKNVIYVTSTLSVAGGSLLWVFVPDGPYHKPVQQFHFTAFFTAFRNKTLRSSAFGYFGHMWELYTYWAFVPVLLVSYQHLHKINMNISLWSFFIIGIGSLACVSSGMISQKIAPKKIASAALLLSGSCCLLAPFLLLHSPQLGFMLFLLFWGVVVQADSPMFSTLVAQNADENVRGTALTIVNCIGFSITIVSIQFIQWISGIIDPGFIYPFLAIGPGLGLTALLRR